MNTSPQKKFDVAVIGGGVIGSSVAYFLLKEDPQLSVCVIEADSTYEYASALRSSGGCRVQFTGEENIAMSLFSIDFIRNFEHAMSTKKHPAHVDWVEGGYLFIVPPEHASQLEKNAAFQRAQGATVELLSPSELKDKFPAMHVDDLGAGAHTPHDGWCDPNGLLWGFRHKAIDLGAVYLTGRVTGAQATGSKAVSVSLDNGETVRAEAFVNATGAWSGDVAKMFGMHLPVSPVCRFEHYFTPGTKVGHLPYVKDLSRLAFRSEGQGYSGGLVDGNATRGYHFDVDHDYFENVVWPAVAHRFPAFEAAKCHRTWSGLYEVNELDGNAVIGAWTSRLPNLYTVAGFSGHGMMHAPAAGRGVAELIIKGRYETIDLTRLGYERVENHQPYAEQGIL
jgi:FAD-dependent oxidoreductase domain-containing protein 1